MARSAALFGVWFYAETVLRGMRSFGVAITGFAILQPLLYLSALGLGLGALVDAGAGPVDGVDYLTFVAPALLVSTVVMSVTGEMTYPVLGGFIWDRLYDGPTASPLQPWQIAMGRLLAVVIRFTAQSAIFWVFMVAFGAAPSGWSWLTVPIGVLTATAFGAPLQAFAATLQGEGYEFAFVERFIVMPMFLFAGTFFPLSVMPVYLQWIGWISPIWHGTELARAVSYGAQTSPVLVAVHLGFLLGCTVVGALLACRIYTRRLHA